MDVELRDRSGHDPSTTETILVASLATLQGGSQLDPSTEVEPKGIGRICQTSFLRCRDWSGLPRDGRWATVRSSASDHQPHSQSALRRTTGVLRLL